MTEARPVSLLPAGVTVLERGWLSSNNVLLRGRDGAALVDSGYSTHSAQTVDLVAHALQGVPLLTLVNTHLHSDHCGGNAALQRRHLGMRTLIPPGLSAAVRDWDEDALSFRATGQLCPPFSIDGTLEPGSSLRLGDLEWQVHAAPGHDQHSVILFEPASRTLISADALWQNGFGVVFQELEGEHAFDDVARTLDVIEHLRPAVVIPGHGSVFTETDAALRRARARLDSYIANPLKHAAHGAKVLLKFKLLEVGAIHLGDLLAWCERTPYFALVQQRWFPAEDRVACVTGFLDQLQRSGALARDGDIVRNT